MREFIAVRLLRWVLIAVATIYAAASTLPAFPVIALVAMQALVIRRRSWTAVLKAA